MTKIVTYIEVDVEDFVDGSPQPDQTFRFAIPTDYLPADIDCIPSIDTISFTPQRISLGKNLGQRASLAVKFRDHKHIFGSESYDSGTFWGKWRARYKTRLRGRNLRIIRGEPGQALTEMDTRYYIIDRVDGPSFDGVYTIEAKDVLKFADEDRSVCPAFSSGSLDGSIDDVTTTAVLSPSGIGDDEYPASGWVCIGGKEVVSFTRSSDTLTITRAQFGSTAKSHDAGDRVQLVKRFTGDDPADIIQDLLVNFAGVPSDYISLSDWQSETSEFLNVIYARTITEPTSVNALVSQMIEQAALAVWWDDRARQVRLKVLREIDTTTNTFDQDIIIEGSFGVTEQPITRISQIWSYYGERDPTDRGSKEDNFRSVLGEKDSDRESDYGSAEIRKIQAAWVETETAASRLNSIQISRFRDPPRAFKFDLPLESLVTPAAGYQLKWWGNQDVDGNEVAAPIQLTQVTLHADRIHVEAEEMLADGVETVIVNVVFLTSTGELLEWDVPNTWNDSDNSIHCIGGGGGGGFFSIVGSSGGGGAYSGVENIALLGSPSDPTSPGLTLQYNVGAGGNGVIPLDVGIDGGDTWIGGATIAASICGAKGGKGGNQSGSGQGGQSSGGIGDIKYSGGDGALGATSGGGGSAGPNGDGADGAQKANGAGGGGADGGSDAFETGGDNRFGFGGGAPGEAGQEGGGGGGGSKPGDAGSDGGAGEQIWTQTISPIVSAGPGGGGGGSESGNAGSGGQYGGGGGNSLSGDTTGSGAQGIIVIKWREA